MIKSKENLQAIILSKGAYEKEAKHDQALKASSEAFHQRPELVWINQTGKLVRNQ